MIWVGACDPPPSPAWILITTSAVVFESCFLASSSKADALMTQLISIAPLKSKPAMPAICAFSDVAIALMQDSLVAWSTHDAMKPSQDLIVSMTAAAIADCTGKLQTPDLQ